MVEKPRAPLALLIGLVLIAGVGIGWILSDLVPRPPSVAPVIVATPTTTAIPPPTPAWTPTAPVPPTPEWTATPIPPPPTPEPVAPTLAPTAMDPTAIPDLGLMQIEGYAAHIVAEGESLLSIAEQGGSSAIAISLYNRLIGEPQPGRALIVPRLAGRTSQLQNPPVLVERGPAARTLVALTLDAGASGAPTPRMLDAMRARGVRITFFLTGRWIRENPDLARQIVADGHEVANHTMTHPDLRELDDDAIRRELADTDAAMREVAGVGTRPFFRPPFGAYDERVLRVVQAEGYLPIYWTLDSLDSVGEPKTPAFLLERVTGKLSPDQLRGAIILAHCGSEATADALPAILDRFDELGLQVVPLSEVLAAR